MARLRNYQSNEQQVLSVPLPEKTESYVPVPNAMLVNALRTRIREEGLQILGSGYRLSNNQQVTTGFYVLSPDDDSGIAQNIIFTNSYDKTRKLQIGSGAIVLVCKNGMFAERLNYSASHLHTGAVLDRVTPMIDTTFKNLKMRFKYYKEVKQIMENSPISKDVIHSLVGKLYMEDEMLNTLQLELLRKNITSDLNFKMVEPEEMNLWRFYNQITEVLKYSHPGDLVNNHVYFHELILDTVKDQANVEIPSISDFISNREDIFDAIVEPVTTKEVEYV